ncbi:hypothetical protein [Laspinema palackyanum]|uniref:hypothetical protein n=1 Tax=Laspinema palackyanum TaxID=3231601 RepID=UPI00345C8ECB|nr:hypothetical protein [Laspinema sp. D2c]
MSEPIRVSESEEVGNKKSMSTTATLYKNGLLSIETFSRSQHRSEGLRGYVLVICMDSAGRAIWISKSYRCTTRCSKFDFTCASAGTDAWQEKLPDEVGKYTTGLDIVQSDEGLGDFRNKVIQGIKTTKEIVDELKPIIQAALSN